MNLNKISLVASILAVILAAITWIGNPFKEWGELSEKVNTTISQCSKNEAEISKNTQRANDNIIKINTDQTNIELIKKDVDKINKVVDDLDKEIKELQAGLLNSATNERTVEILTDILKETISNNHKEAQ